MTKNSIRLQAAKAVSRLRFFYREAGYWFKVDREVRRDEKKQHRRALRRLNKAHTKEDCDELD